MPSDINIPDLLEPAVRGQPPYVAAPISIAISLKRIADFVCGRGDEEPILDIVQYFSKEIRDVLDR